MLHEHTYNALHVVMVMVRVMVMERVNPNLAYSFDYTAHTHYNGL